MRSKYADQFAATLQAAISEAERAGLVKANGLRVSLAPNKVPNPSSVDVIKSTHACGPMKLEKRTGLPPESSNGSWDETRARDGATLAHDVNEADSRYWGQRPKPALLTPPHSSYIRDVQALRTQDDGGNDPQATLAAIKIAQSIPRRLTPGALRGEVQNPNRDDGLR